MFYLKELSLNNFRCYKHKKITFKNKINILVGKNATGKTSLVEAIYVLIGCKSHRAKSDSEIIMKNTDYYLVKGEFCDDVDTNIMVSSSKEGKKVIKDNKGFSSLSDYIGLYGAVMFCPEDLMLITKDPATRRRFLDQSISQFNKTYLESLIKYKKLLKQRNELLKNYDSSVQKAAMLNVYTQALINEATIIINERQKFIENLNPFFDKAVKVISSGEESAKIIYSPNCTIEKLASSFADRQNYDIITKTTSTGPHRDDFNVYLNDMDGGIYCSQGQQKTLALAIKLGLAEMLRRINPKMIIILDDVFGELDENRQNELLKLFDLDNQIFITTTSIDNLDNRIISESNVVEINKDGE